MAQFFAIHKDNPQIRLIQEASHCIEQGGVVVIPTDSGYALSCALENKRGVEIIRQIRRLDDKHNFTLLCRDLSEISVYARVGNQEYRLLKAHTPGAYTFILEATREVPRRLLHPKRKQIGIRIPDNRIALDLLGNFGEPLMTSSLMLPNEQMPMTDPHEIMKALGHTLDLVIDGGFCGFEGTTVVDLTNGLPIVTRLGAGDSSAFSDLV
ncbi:MAG TPA: threonylcarbamoyl-AMP synthase [Gammaproteobacteria bacterium]|nr:threonylcarbamoyl-AMP synthase [Gammaproteobacteria bacterium]HBX27420.1 threonylcarbamoyl-AMP synthase [Gammaproteobacteria bacterium]